MSLSVVKRAWQIVITTKLTVARATNNKSSTLEHLVVALLQLFTWLITEITYNNIENEVTCSYTKLQFENLYFRKIINKTWI